MKVYWVQMIDLDLIFRYLKDTSMATNFVKKNGKLPFFVALAFWNGMGYCYLNVRINSINDTSISCKNFVNFGPVAHVGPGQSLLIPSLPHLLYPLVPFHFSLSYSCFIYVLAFHPFPFYQNSPTPFPRPDVVEATKRGFSFICVDFMFNDFFS